MKIFDSLYLMLITVLLVASLLGFAVLRGGEETLPLDGEDSGYRVAPSGERYTVPMEEMTRICLGTGCIPPLDSPSFTRDPSWMEESDTVIGVVHEGRSYAFPLDIMRYHAVANTNISEDPVAVTYSPYSGAPRVFSREAGGRTLDLTHSGLLYRGNMVMEDPVTGSLWSQFSGEAIRGEAVPGHLERLEADMVRWSIWRSNHPSTLVLSRNTGIYNRSAYRSDIYFNYRNSRWVPADTSIEFESPKEVVYGIRSGGDAMAYRSANIRGLDLIQDRVGGVPVMVVHDEKSGTVEVYVRKVRGEETDFSLEQGRLVDSRTGSTWNMDGEATSGPLEGENLQEIDVTRSYWYTWKLFHPGTSLYEPGD